MYVLFIKKLCAIIVVSFVSDNVKLMIDIGTADSNLLLLKYVLFHTLFLFVLYISFIKGLKCKQSTIIIASDRIKVVRIFFLNFILFSVLWSYFYYINNGQVALLILLQIL